MGRVGRTVDDQGGLGVLQARGLLLRRPATCPAPDTGVVLLKLLTGLHWRCRGLLVLLWLLKRAHTGFCRRTQAVTTHKQGVWCGRCLGFIGCTGAVRDCCSRQRQSGLAGR